jgi:4-hydroxyacetophenone monooxygenase
MVTFTAEPSDSSRMEQSAGDELRSALDVADIRVLLMVLYQFTGDHRWLDDPYRPMRDVRLIAEPNAGLDEDIRNEVKAAAFDLLNLGIPEPAIARPTDAQMLEMMRFCLGENVAEEYVPMMLQEMGFSSDQTPRSFLSLDTSATRSPFSVAIIGAGISGIAAAIRFRQADIPIEVFEKNPDVGGTWFENTYPDCGVDTPNHFYSYSFSPNTDWKHYFSLRDEIFQYIKDCVDKFDIRSSIRFGETVTSAEWNEDARKWIIHSRSSDGVPSTTDSRVLISAVGQMNRPQFPIIDDLARFAGKVFHSAEWPDDVDLHDKAVGVVGVGASAMQFVPRIANDSSSLAVFQRSTQWARPIGEYRAAVPDGVKWLIKNVQFYGAWLRFNLEWRYGDGLHRHLFKDESWPYPERSLNSANDRHRVELTEYIRHQLDDDEDLISKVLPSYPPYAKRMLIDNGWYQTIKLPKVTLTTDPIDHAYEGGLATRDGTIYELDVLILATGFKATNLLGHMEITGRGGIRLRDRWGEDDPRAYLGMTVPKFPNFFILYGPNTNLAHGGSIIFHAECQVRYLLDLFEQMCSRGYESVEIREEVHDQYNEAVDAAHERMVWTHQGVAPWYRNKQGRVVSNSPWRLVDYWHMTHHAQLEEFRVDGGEFNAGIN